MGEFKALVKAVMDGLPPEVRGHTGNVVVEVRAEPTVKMMRQVGFTDEQIEAGETLLGLFDPFPLPDESPDVPHRLLIFKRPHEDCFPDPAELREEIRKTVLHELAHHFGLNERDVDELGYG